MTGNPVGWIFGFVFKKALRNLQYDNEILYLEAYW